MNQFKLIRNISSRIPKAIICILASAIFLQSALYAQGGFDYEDLLQDANWNIEPDFIKSRFFISYSPIHGHSVNVGKLPEFAIFNEVAPPENLEQMAMQMAQQDFFNRAGDQIMALTSSFLIPRSPQPTPEFISRPSSSIQMQFNRDAFAKHYVSIVAEYMARLVVSGKAKVFGIKIFNDGSATIALPSETRQGMVDQVQFHSRESIMQFPLVNTFVNCYFSNGVSTADRLKGDCKGMKYVNVSPLPRLTVARYISEAAFCYGIDPIVFTGLIFRESDFQEQKPSTSGVGITQLTSNGILEWEHQHNTERFREIAETLNRASRSEFASKNTVSEAQQEMFNQNLRCFDRDWNSHNFRINPEDVAESIGGRTETSYIRKIKGWLTRSELQPGISKDVLIQRQIVYGAGYLKVRLSQLAPNYIPTKIGKTDGAKSKYRHYWTTIRNYNGNKQPIRPGSSMKVRDDYANAIVNRYPQLLGVKIPETVHYSCDQIYAKYLENDLPLPLELRTQNPRCFHALNTFEI